MMERIQLFNCDEYCDEYFSNEAIHILFYQEKEVAKEKKEVWNLRTYMKISINVRLVCDRKLSRVA